jgi:2-C-methyl-D-erythritol 4-phosphate cytidylyltransferase / 2-C-methyl-D-erythritol 2,4-cyclodiphosphate synthase
MNSAVILAGGSGKRMGAGASDKVLMPLCGGVSALGLCICAFEKSGCVNRIVITFRDDAQRALIEALVTRLDPCCEVTFARGGAERMDSVLSALVSLPFAEDDGLVFIHDAARPLVTAEDVRELCDLATAHGAAAMARPVTDTIKRIDAGAGEDIPVLEDLPRAQLRAMETPQVFRTGTIRTAYLHAKEVGAAATDDAAAAALMDVHPALKTATHANPKLTTPDDIALVNFILSQKCGVAPSMNAKLPNFRIGHGYDIHRFAAGRKLVLGGVEIAHARGLDGHSDADCLCHAIADSILGAAGLPDIGHYYPPGNAETKDMNSLEIVRGAVARAAELGLSVGNVDATLVAREPKIAPHVAAMKEKLSAALGIPAARIGIKATTNEDIDGLGRGDGIAAYAVVLLV